MSDPSHHVSASGARLLFDPALVPSSIGERLPSYLVVRTAPVHYVDLVRTFVLTIIVVGCTCSLYRLDPLPAMTIPTTTSNFFRP